MDIENQLYSIILNTYLFFSLLTYLPMRQLIKRLIHNRMKNPFLLQNRLLRIEALVVFGGVTSILMLHNNRARITMA